MILDGKKVWLEEEEGLLKTLYEEEQLRDWSEIAKKLSNRFGSGRRSAKQCRQRYENHICTEIHKTQWNLEEERELIRLHNVIGNKWSLIAQRLPDKSDNCVKNHFYSRLRKILRKLNNVIQLYLRREFREINISVIYKIVEATQERLKEKPLCREEVSAACMKVQNKLLAMAISEEDDILEEEIDKYKAVIREICSASKLYKRRSKKCRNSSIKAPKCNRKLKNMATEKGYDSDSSSGFDQNQPVSESLLDSKRLREEEVYSSQPQRAEPLRGVTMASQQQSIRGILNHAAVLNVDQADFGISKKCQLRAVSQQSDNKGYTSNDYDPKDYKGQFFDDSDADRKYNRNLQNRRFSKAQIEDPSDRSEREGYELFTA